MLKIDFDNFTNEDYKEMDKLNMDITQFMKRNYDNDSPSMEMNVWFQYADIFGQPSDENMPLTLLKNSIELKEKLVTISNEVDDLSEDYNKKSTIYQDYEAEYDRTQDHIDRLNG